ncbi:unnamed protein product [Hymenolepis diminuta]|uniref:Uncharacterized protein n=1 Tax=Hymenolepis diminuta TaxID=6216 RepID=A0A3P6ZWM2_HYMDI|nr:unnamed protein product [Hymenolepis diminuta]
MEGLEETSHLVEKQSGISLICYTCDLSDRNAIQNLANEIRIKHGRVTLLVSNAGIVNGNYLIDVPIEKVEQVIEVNLMAPFYLIKEFLPGMLGRIPTIGTAVGDYCASKAGLSALVDSLRLELEAMGMYDKIAVTDIRPYVIDTGMFEGFNSKYTLSPFYRLSILPILKPEYVAKQIVEAIRYRKRIVYIPWIIWLIPLLQRFIGIKIVIFPFSLIHFPYVLLFSFRLLPFKFLVFLYKIGGAFDGMNTFTRANKKQD